ncbi:MAG: hypothetical protein IT167_23055 [Bryobacterales bacterium]|nr:hypothetical protein [Bryobacterales bacterium]
MDRCRNASVILDNLIAQGEAEPMIMANPLGYGAPEMIKALTTGRGGGREMMEKNIQFFAQALYAGLDRFAWLASFAGAFMMWSDAWWSLPSGSTSSERSTIFTDLQADT